MRLWNIIKNASKAVPLLGLYLGIQNYKMANEARDFRLENMKFNKEEAAYSKL